MAKIPGGTTLRRRFGRSLSLVVAGTALALLLGGWWLLLKPSIDSIAADRIGRISTRVETHLLRLGEDTDRLLYIAADWLRGDGLALNHRSLNRRFMPLLARFPAYSSLLIAGSGGNEWMLFRRTDGTWLNRLTAGDETDDTRRFLSWKNADTLLKDERLASDYSPLQRPWFRQALESPPGEPVWTEIYRFHTSGKPGITAALRIPGVDDASMVLGLDLQLEDIARYLASLNLGERSHAVLITEEGRLLGSSGLPQDDQTPTAAELVFQPVIGLPLQPLKKGFDLWLHRARQPLEDHLTLHHGEIWHLGYRRLQLGERNLWLISFLPLSELVPGLYMHLMALFGLLLLSLFAAIGVSRRTARLLSQPLGQLAANSRRIGELDFASPPPLPDAPYEVRELARAQDRMRDLLSTAHAELVQKNRALEQAQGQLVQAAKMESVGRLGAGIAHEVGNPLAIIQMGLDFLQQDAGSNSENLEVLKDMEQAVVQADAIVRGLLDFSREQELELRDGDLNQAIQHALHLVEHETRQQRIRVDTHLADNLPRIRMDPDKLAQVFVNLFINAVHVMGREGTLNIVTDLRTLETDHGLDLGGKGLFAAGDQVLWVEVADSGPGFEPEVLAHIFDPFFTTKATGEGIGLGLSVSRRIVELHGGCIDIRNRTGGGASAVLLFKSV